MAAITAGGRRYSGSRRKKSSKKAPIRNAKTMRIAVNRQKGLLWVILFGALLLFIVFTCAASANIMRENNQLENKNSYLQAEIDSMNTKLNNSMNIGTIEDMAVNKYGMVHPGPENTVNIDGKKSGKINLADTMKKEAYE